MRAAKQRIIVIHDNTCPSGGYNSYGDCDCPAAAIQATLASVDNAEALTALLEASKALSEAGDFVAADRVTSEVIAFFSSPFGTALSGWKIAYDALYATKTSKGKQL